MAVAHRGAACYRSANVASHVSTAQHGTAQQSHTTPSTRCPGRRCSIRRTNLVHLVRLLQQRLEDNVLHVLLVVLAAHSPVLAGALRVRQVHRLAAARARAGMRHAESGQGERTKPRPRKGACTRMVRGRVVTAHFPALRGAAAAHSSHVAVRVVANAAYDGHPAVGLGAVENMARLLGAQDFARNVRKGSGSRQCAPETARTQKNAACAPPSGWCGLHKGTAAAILGGEEGQVGGVHLLCKGGRAVPRGGAPSKAQASRRKKRHDARGVFDKGLPQADSIHLFLLQRQAWAHHRASGGTDGR